MSSPIFNLDDTLGTLEMCHGDDGLLRGCVIHYFLSGQAKKNGNKNEKMLYEHFDEILKLGGESARKIIECAADARAKKNAKKTQDEKKKKSADRKDGWDKRWEVGRYSFTSHTRGVKGEFEITKITKGGFACITTDAKRDNKPFRRYLRADGMPILINYAEGYCEFSHPLQITYGRCKKM